MMETSSEAWHRAQRCIAQGTLTANKHPSRFEKYPTHIKNGSGCYVYDEKDQKYIDYMNPTNLLGYGNDKISRELIKHIYAGFTHSLPTIHELNAAEKLKEIFPFCERFKFLTGTKSQVQTLAIRIAELHTGRAEVLDEEDEQDGLRITTRTACIVVKPVSYDNSRDRIEWLNKIRDKCNRTGTLLIFDETQSGFRYKKMGACNAYGITPDLIMLGGSMANGLPLTAVGGRALLMDNSEYTVDAVFSGEILSLVSCFQVAKLLQADSDYSLSRLWEHGQQFIDTFNKQPSNIKLKGYPTSAYFDGDYVEKRLFFKEMAKSGILFSSLWFYNFCHIPLNELILDLCLEIKERIANKEIEGDNNQGDNNLG